MARIRSIKPETPKDELLGSLPREVRLLFVFLWTVADDEGRFRASPALIKAELFPYDDDLTADQVRVWLELLHSVERIRLYEENSQRYGVVLRFRDHQRIEKPTASRLPAPPAEHYPITPRILVEDSPTPPGIVADSSPTPPGGIGREGKGVEEEGISMPTPDGAAREYLVKRKRETPHPDHRRFVDLFDSAYRQTHDGARPTWSAVTGRMVRDLLTRHGYDECARRLEVLASGQGPSWLTAWDLKSFVAHFDKLATPTIDDPLMAARAKLDPNRGYA